jgi:ABC-type transport system substrate-binding protein
LTTNYNTLSTGFGLGKMHTSRIGSPANNWLGTNRIGYSNPEFDRLYDLWNSALDRGERNQYMIAMAKLLSEQLPVFPLYLNFEVVAHIAGLHGPRPGDPDSTPYHNLHDWTWE